MRQGRRLNSSMPEGIARTSTRGKNLPDTIPTAHGMKRASGGIDLAPFHHGIALQDQPATVKSFESAAPVHPGTPNAGSGNPHSAELGNAVLHEAANLGRPAKNSKA